MSDIRITSKVFRAESVYIDPSDCDSTVSYKIVLFDYLDTGGSRVDTSMQLSDCNRKIDWYFRLGNAQETAESLAKVDRVLEMLTDYRSDMVAASLIQRRKDKIRDKAKAAKDKSK